MVRSVYSINDTQSNKIVCVFFNCNDAVEHARTLNAGKNVPVYQVENSIVVNNRMV